MKAQSLLFGIISLGSLSLLGCGSNVTADEGGGGSGQSAGGSSDGGSSDTGGAAGTGGTISGDEAVAQACGAWCEAAPNCMNDGQTCEEFCALGAPAGCELEYAALTDCVVPYTQGDCIVPTDNCPEERQAFAACSANAPPTQCSLTMLDQGDSACEGSGLCVNGQSARMSCTASPTGITCQCFVDDALLGECSDTELTCALSYSCCSQFY